MTTGLLHARQQLRANEALVVQWVVGPSHVSAVRPIEFTPLEQLGLKTPRQPEAGDKQAWKQKLAEPLFGVRGRIGAVATNPKRAGSLLRPVLAALSLANGSQARMRASQQSSRTAEQLHRVVGRTRTWSGLVNASELAAFLAWPLVEIPGMAAGFAAPPPALLYAGASTPDRLLGTSQHPASKGANIYMPFASYAAHLHVIGPSGVGKSTLLAGWIGSEAAAGRSVLLIEPKGDLVTDVLARLHPKRHDDVVVIEPGSSGAVTGFNPLAGNRADAERRADALLHLFRELFGTAIGPRSADVLLHALIMVCRLDDGTLTDVPAILTNPGFRRQVLAKVSDPLTIAPWAAWFDGLSEAERGQVVAPVLNKLRVLVSRPAIRRLLSQSKPHFSLDELFSRRKIVLINLNAGAVGQEASKVLGSLVLSQLWEAIQRQTAVPMHRRREVAVVVDEWQEFTAGLDFADVLARARGARVSFTVAHQHLDQLNPNLRAAVLANARARVAFRPAEGDARALAKVLGGSVAPEDLEQLDAFHAVARVLVNGAPSAAFEIATPKLPTATADPDQQRAASSACYGVDPAELDAAVVARWHGGDLPPDAPVGVRRRSS